MSDDYYIPPPDPFWFASSGLLADVVRAELTAMIQLLATHPELRSVFDDPEATIPQRKICFAVLAHRKAFELIDQNFVGRYEDFPPLGDEELNAIRLTAILVTDDAPDWALEMVRVVDALPYNLLNALPIPLQTRGYDENNAERTEAIQSAKHTLNTVEQIRALVERVFDEQLERLARRWSVAMPLTMGQASQSVPKKRKTRRTRDKQRIKRDRTIAEIDDISSTIVEFLQVMDERDVLPQPTWKGWPGSWKQAYKDRRLRTLIHKDKSRALARARKK